MTNSTTVGQRFTQLIQSLGLSKNAFAASLGKTATVIQHLVDERNKPGFDLLNKIFEVYPNVSKEWLLTGSGSMLVSSTPETMPAAPPTKSQPNQTAAAPPVPPAPIPAAEPQTAKPDAAAELKEAVAFVSSPTSLIDTQPQPAIPPATLPMQPPVAAAVPTDPAAFANAVQAALYAQQLHHQLALAELRNQSLVQQQAMMQQMVELLQKQLVK